MAATYDFIRKFGGCCRKYLEIGGLKELTSTEDYIKKKSYFFLHLIKVW
jgi:hypothetical protein